MTQEEGKQLDLLIESYKTGKIDIDKLVLEIWKIGHESGKKELVEENEKLGGLLFAIINGTPSEEGLEWAKKKIEEREARLRNAGEDIK